MGVAGIDWAAQASIGRRMHAALPGCCRSSCSTSATVLLSVILYSMIASGGSSPARLPVAAAAAATVAPPPPGGAPGTVWCAPTSLSSFKPGRGSRCCSVAVRRAELVCLNVTSTRPGAKVGRPAHRRTPLSWLSAVPGGCAARNPAMPAWGQPACACDQLAQCRWWGPLQAATPASNPLPAARKQGEASSQDCSRPP